MNINTITIITSRPKIHLLLLYKEKLPPPPEPNPSGGGPLLLPGGPPGPFLFLCGFFTGLGGRRKEGRLTGWLGGGLP